MIDTFRFAPSPNGHLHLGHAWSATLNRRLADRAGGRLLLRIEDIDPTRCRPEYETAMLADLRWLGIQFDGTPIRQSRNLPRHEAALKRLHDKGVLYPCFCSRADIARSGERRRDPDGAILYPGTCRGLDAATARQRMEAGDPFAWRLDVEKALAVAGRDLTWTELDENLQPASRHFAAPGIWGDVVLARKEVPTSYHLAVVIDDAAEGVTHVVRGRDLFAATAIHLLLQRLLLLPQPLYHHHALVLDADGRKLSKATRSTGLAELREAGWTPEAVEAAIAAQMGG